MSGIELSNLPVDVKIEKTINKVEKFLRIETDQMEICRPKNFRKKIWLGTREKLCFAHLTEKGRLHYWEK